MPITFSYNIDLGKLSIAGLTAGTSYTIYRSTGETLSTGYTASSYSDYFIKAGTGFTTFVKDSVGIQATYYNSLYTYNNSFLISSDTNKNQQISIIFDENISSFRPVRKDFVQETIGSKYPFVIRNANVNYRTMDFSGMINREMDGENISTYGTVEVNSNYDAIFTAERNFRDWFEIWVNDGKPKLLKTSSEGLFIVRLHNLSMTPIRQTGRVIYSFNCSITEIAEFSIENLKKYKFIS